MKLPWMSCADRRRWQSARTLTDLARLMASWLEGDIASQPGYQPRYGPDPETTELIPVLAAANRAGFLTIASQPGVIETDANGRHWEQRAVVEGFIADHDLVHRLANAAAEASLTLVVHDLSNVPGTGGIVGTTLNGKPYTVFGPALGSADLNLIWSGCSRQAITDVARARQVTLADPRFGPYDDLWQVLGTAIAQPTPDPGPKPHIH